MIARNFSAVTVSQAAPMKRLAKAVFGFPLRTGEVRLGALNLYRSGIGDLTADQHANALVLADLITETVLLFAV